ncbi:ATP-binding cassette domain-containing protein [Kocuria sp. M4R2S49]|uniref:ATP-binding cassette domain-containing protein n=1 Tax=Kocuria rhizosphaericola TaxID=3376284 RepID=UPI0037A6A010
MKNSTARAMQDPALSAEDPILSVESVSKTFGPVKALQDISITFYPGQVHALLGENGAGKSTLMGIISGALDPSAGSILVGGENRKRLTPEEAVRHGISIVHQTPALAPDLTVAENMALTVPESMRPPLAQLDPWVREQLSKVGSTVSPSAQCADLPISDLQLIEIARALAVDTRLLILDEPTAPLDQDKVALLFEKVRSIAAAGVGVVYITHRIPEIRELADTMTILRDGRMRGTYDPQAKTDDEIVALIAGREIEAVFPDKGLQQFAERPALEVRNLSNEILSDVSFKVRPGEIVGIAGVAGNGQPQVLRSLAGLEPAKGEVLIEGQALKMGSVSRSRSAGLVFMPADRAKEGVLPGFSIRENATLSALGRFRRGITVNSSAESQEALGMTRGLGVKAPSLDTPVGNLSGGNQQKVVLARALLANPRVVLTEEPTQGVDAGARSEIYTQLRAAAADGLAVLVVSSDAMELEGLCDRVIVMSSGSIVTELEGDQVTETNMMQAMVASHTQRHTRDRDDAPTRSKTRGGFDAATLRNSAPTVVISAAILAIGLLGIVTNIRFIGEPNIYAVLLSTSALALVALGQFLVVMTGGIDLSVGPLTGLVLVISSFFWTEDAGELVSAGGLAMILVVAAAIGALNGALVALLNLPAVAATLITYIAIQGVSLLLRPQISGYIAVDTLDLINTRIGVVPVAFIIVCLLGAVMAFILQRTLRGVAFRATGSAPAIATKVGVPVRWYTFAAYVLAALLAALGGIMLVGQVGVGDPTQGVGFTLSSITVVVVAGTLLRGGVGSPVAVLLGAILLQTMFSLTNFLQLSSQWQYWVQGAIILAAAVFYISLRNSKKLNATT